MSKADLERFAKDIRTNDALKAEARSAGTDEAAVAAFANKKGYDFTAAELKEYADARKAELSAEDLDKVAGGDVTWAASQVEIATQEAVMAGTTEAVGVETTAVLAAEVVIVAT
jgi:predicted ribosomally synthesized peptide with nif11-like leader